MHVHDYVLESGDYFSREWQDKTLQNSALMLSIDASIVENEYLVETVGKCIVLRVVRSIVYHDRKESVLRSSTRYAWQLCKNDATGIRMIQGNQMQWHDHSFINPIPDGDWIIYRFIHIRFALTLYGVDDDCWETLEASLGAIRKPSRTQGRCELQSGPPLFPISTTWLRIEDYVICNCSVKQVMCRT